MVIDIRKASNSLSKSPERGHIPADFSQIGQFEYRPIIEKNTLIYAPAWDCFLILIGKRNVRVEIAS
jgi:hypothetical protein